MIREVTVFTNGDSCKLNTWSNVPYFFTETFIKKGIKVNRIDISPSIAIEKVYNRFLTKYVRRKYPNTTYDYFRSRLHFFLVSSQVLFSMFKYRKSDKFIFLTFSFSTLRFRKSDVIQFGDWTYDYYFKYFLERDPDMFEKLAVRRELRQMQNVSFVVPLFKTVHEYMISSLSMRNVKYLSNVINNNYGEIDESEIIQRKIASNKILFVGNVKYLDGAIKLLDAFIKIQMKYPDLELHIIGMSNEDLGIKSENVFCYGYLSKDNIQQNEMYYSLFLDSILYVNPTPKWSAFSATIEAMYYCMPVVVERYPEFTALFGERNDSIFYSSSDAPHSLHTLILQFLERRKDAYLYQNARNTVQHHTWGNFIDNLLLSI
jgi:glycosyltransferase involved in cell wall biosynthesis